MDAAQTERPPSADLPAGAPDGLKRATDAKPGTDPFPTDGSPEQKAEAFNDEVGALDYLLGQQAPQRFSVKTHVDTDKGRKALTFHLHQIDGDKIIELEDENRKGSGPFAELDDVRLNAGIVSEALIELEDETGKKTDAKSPEFIGQFVDPKIALEKRFQFNPGILAGVAGQVRGMAAYSGDRVEPAEHAVKRAVSNS